MGHGEQHPVKGVSDMSRIEETVEIKRPTDKVFVYVTDAKTWSKWNVAMIDAEQTSPGPVAVGTTYLGANKVMGRRMPWTAKVTEYAANKKLVSTISSGSTLIDERFALDSAGGGTKLTEVYDVKIGGFLKLFAPMIISTMRKEMKANLGSLKRILETET
jgi:uncharacterized protein YndB with AHSA1/START domain